MEKDFINKIVDQLLEEASSKYLENEEEKIKEVDDSEFSDIHKQKMKKLFKEVRKNETRKKAVKITKRVAVIVLCAILITGGLITSVEAWREEVVKFILKNNSDNYMSIEFGDNRYEISGEIYENYENNSYETDEIKFLYLPEGFEIEYEKATDAYVQYSFINNDKFIRLKEEKLENNYSKKADIENTDNEKFEIGNKEVFKVEKENSRMQYIWYDEVYSYSVTANIDEKEILKFIENIKILKKF